MARVHQFYGGDGVPWSLPSDPTEVVAAWRTHRERLRGWYRGLHLSDWSQPTRCSDWDATAMAQHLVSGAQFLGYTLHQARKGEATRFLDGFDAQETAAVATAQLDGLSPRQLLDELEKTDERVDAELAALEREGWEATAEAPPGHVGAHIAVNHFLFDSWVHERDLLLPTGEQPPTDPCEAALVVSYVLGLAALARTVGDEPPDDVIVRVHLADLDREVSSEVVGGRAHVTFADGGRGTGAAATADALVVLATGRSAPGVVDEGLARYLGRLATVMA